MRRIVILTDGKTDPIDGKTAAGVVRYRGDEVVAIFDRSLAGSTCDEVLGLGGDIPVIADLSAVDGDTLLIGIAPPGGRLPNDWREVIRDAITRGMSLVSGLHMFLADDPEIASLAAEQGVEIHDVRRPPENVSVSKDEARHTSCFRVHTVGHDCSVGKMLVAAELTNELVARGRRAKFIATGQTGIMIAEGGVAVDAVVSDFVAGAIEAEVLASADHEFIVVEGQGSLYHPLYSGVTLGLLHGCSPQAMVMCVDATRDRLRHCDLATSPLEEVIETYERMSRLLVPGSRVCGVAANTSALDDDDAERFLEQAREVSGLSVADPIRHGCGPLVDALESFEEDERAAASARGAGR